MRRAVVFDLDGTLLDSLPLVLAAISHAVEPFGTQPTMEIFATLGGPPAQFLGPLIGDMKNLPVALHRLGTFHRENVHLIRPYAGVTGVLNQLRQHGVQVGLWTGRDRVSADWLLQHHGLDAYFSAIVCGDDLASHKPDPAGLVEIMRRLKVAPSETLLVGDSDVDVLGGAGGGVDTLLIRHERAIEAGIAAKSWEIVPSPEAAFVAILKCVQNISRNQSDA